MVARTRKYVYAYKTFIDHEGELVSTFRNSARRGIAAAGLTCAIALISTACGGVTKSDSDACGDGSGGGNLTTCIGISDVSTDKGDAVIPAGTSVKIVCNDGDDNVGIIIPDEIKNADTGKAEWKYNGKAAARGVPSKYFNSVPGGLRSCDSALKSA